MPSKKITSATLLPVALLVAFLVIGYYALVHKKHTDQALQPSSATAAPPLSLLKVTPNVQQQRFDLKEMRGQKVLVNFFASWCVPCIAELPELRQIARQNGLAIVGVAYNDNVDAVLGFLDKYGNAYARVVLDPMGRTAIEWGLKGVPESYLVDEKGNLLIHYPGPITGLVWAQYFAPHFAPPSIQ
jgi:cytochrome c biogenesis protein CcmG/thiol:disulfide interchange protein DsbE